MKVTEENAMPPGLTKTLTQMGLRPDPGALERAMELIGGSWGELSRLRSDAHLNMDVSEADGDELRSVLSLWLAESSGVLIVAWPTDRVATEMPVSSLLDSIDDLWYPAMDDLVVLEVSSMGERLVLVLDHEERLTCTRLATHTN
ncbi:hypothetical protein ACFCZV_15115 [Streptomyces hydrogenans]|uniref:hypothetical protein n=1 Tax=Streptomyces hydrogenans TaxID=1873719 RepID=UPI0035DF02A7